MKRHARIPRRCLKLSLALVALLVRSFSGLAQVRDLPWEPESPGWSAGGIRLRYLELDAEAETDKYRSASGVAQQDSTRLYVTPRIGIGWNGYIYHPYLFTYSL